MGRSAASLRLISCHLGGTSSLCAIQNGRSVDTTLGFSPQSGLEHASRSGELDPFAVLYVMEKENLSPSQISSLLCKKSGLLGISGVSSDVRDLEGAAAKGHHRAALALDVFIYEIKKYIGAYAAALGGLDAVAFAGGIGENSCRVREGVCQGMEFLGLHLDPEKVNVMGGGTAIGHALGATGIRLVGTLARTLNVKGGRYGLANACVGGGQGVAAVIEREDYNW
jgi:acetate kinase